MPEETILFPSLTGPLNHLDGIELELQEVPPCSFPSLTGPLNHLDDDIWRGAGLCPLLFPSLTGPLNHLDYRDTNESTTTTNVSIPNGPPQPFRPYFTVIPHINADGFHP